MQNTIVGNFNLSNFLKYRFMVVALEWYCSKMLITKKRHVMKSNNQSKILTILNKALILIMVDAIIQLTSSLIKTIMIIWFMLAYYTFHGHVVVIGISLFELLLYPYELLKCTLSFPFHTPNIYSTNHDLGFCRLIVNHLNCQVELSLRNLVMYKMFSRIHKACCLYYDLKGIHR